MTLRERFLMRAGGCPDQAAALLAAGLMEGDRATFKAGYSRENALLAACEMFPEADPEDVEQHLAGLGR